MSDGERTLSRRILLGTGATALVGLAGCSGNSGSSTETEDASTSTPANTPTSTPTATETPEPTESREQQDLSNLNVFAEEVRRMLDEAGLLEIPESRVEDAQEAYRNGDVEEAIRTVGNETMKRSGPGSLPPYTSEEAYSSTAAAQAARNIVTYLSQGTPPGEAGPNDFAETKQFLEGETAEGFQKPETPSQYLGIDPQGPNLSGIPDVKRVFIQGQMADILTYDHHGGGDYIGFAPRPGQAATHRLNTQPQTQYQESLAGLTEPQDHANANFLDYETSLEVMESLTDVNVEGSYEQLHRVEGDAVLGPRSGVQRNETRTPLLFTQKGFQQLSGGSNRHGLVSYPIRKLTQNVVETDKQEGEIYVVGNSMNVAAVEHDFTDGRPEI